MLRPVQTVAPAANVVSTDDIKGHVIAVEFDDDDALLDRLVSAATAHLDGWSGILGRCLISQTWRIDIDGFCYSDIPGVPSGYGLRLPFPDVSEITSITYYDADNVQQTVAGSSYSLKEDAVGSFVWFDSDFTIPSMYLRPDAMSVTFVAGYGDAATDVPEPIRQAIMLLAAHWYKNRAATSDAPMSELPFAVSSLIAPYRRTRL